MERLSGLDASFLYLETPTLHMHVSMAAVFDPSTINGGYSFERVRELVRGRLVQAPVFTAPARRGPLPPRAPLLGRRPGLRHRLPPAAGPLCPRPAAWTSSPSSSATSAAASSTATKPLWQMYIVEGLENGNFALVTKMHHSTIDGVSGAELLAKLFDLTSEPAEATTSS